jgi:hypothetical protein
MRSKRRCWPELLILVPLISQYSLSANANPSAQLRSEAASLDASPPRRSEPDKTQPIQTQPPEEHKSKTLNGAVETTESLSAAQDDNNATAAPTQDATKNASQNLQPETATRGPLYWLALKKLSAKKHLTADEFRSLGIGILGAEFYRTYYQEESKVEDLYPGCPAILAGMQIGDMVLDQNAEAEDAQIKDPTRPSWMFTCGLEGQKVDFKVNRRGELLTFHLVRMNMEDVPDPKIRRNYEKMVERLGGQEGSVFVPKP